MMPEYGKGGITYNAAGESHQIFYWMLDLSAAGYPM